MLNQTRTFNLSFIFTTLVFIVSVVIVHAQERKYPTIVPQSDFPPSLISAVNTYIEFYSKIGDTSQPFYDKEFKLLFEDEQIDNKILAIDFPLTEQIQSRNFLASIGDSISLKYYLGKLKNANDFNEKSYFSKPINVSRQSTILRGFDKNENWKLWFEKTYTFKPFLNSPDTTTTIFTEVTFAKSPKNANKYAIIKVRTVSSLPKDKDDDFIADNYDRRIKKLSNQQNIAITAKGFEAKGMYRKHPSTRMGFTFSAGLLSPLSTKLLEKDITNNMLIIKPNYFYKRGLIITTEYEYIISNKLNVFIGTSFMRNQLDSKNMQKEVRDIMVENFRTDTFAFQRLTRDIYNPYIGFSIGNFSHKKNVVTLGFLLGIAIPAEKGKYLEFTNYSETINDGVGTIIEQKYKAVFNATPFFTEGIRLKYEYSFLHEGSGKIFLLLNMLTGNMDFPDSYIGTPGNYQIRFDGGRIYLWSAQIGFNFCLKKPKILVEQNRFLDSKKLMN